MKIRTLLPLLIVLMCLPAVAEGRHWEKQRSRSYHQTHYPPYWAPAYGYHRGRDDRYRGSRRGDRCYRDDRRRGRYYDNRHRGGRGRNGRFGGTIWIRF